MGIQSCSCFAFGIVVTDEHLCAAVSEFVAKNPEGEKTLAQHLRYPGDSLHTLCLSDIEKETGVGFAIVSDYRNSKSAPMDWFVFIEDLAMNGDRLAQCVDAESDTLRVTVEERHRRAIASFRQKTGLTNKWSWCNFSWLD